MSAADDDAGRVADRPVRLRLRHRTEFAYDQPVAGSFNESRTTPLTDARQTVLSSRTAIEPVTWTHTYTDYWGTEVTAFEVLTRHRRLVVTSTALVDVRPSPPAGDCGWDELRERSTRDALAEWVAVGEHTEPGEELRGLASAVLAEHASPAETAREVCGIVHRTVEYVPGATGVHTRAVEAWDQRKGVCQDLAHLAVGALRGVGVPARYVSGYLHPSADAPVGETVLGESHAWVEWWAGGWHGWDPTHDGPVGSLHVTVGRGREYHDVSPVRGIVSGVSTSTLTAQVEVTREA